MSKPRRKRRKDERPSVWRLRTSDRGALRIVSPPEMDLPHFSRSLASVVAAPYGHAKWLGLTQDAPSAVG